MRVKIALFSILILVLSACSSSNEINEVTNSSGIAANELHKIQEYSRGAVSEFQKLLEGQNTSFNSYDELFNHYEINNEKREEFRKYINSHEREGYLKSIIFIPASEVVHKNENNFIYQVTTESTRRLNSESLVKHITFELHLTKTKLGSVQLQPVSFEEGHSLDGQKEIAKNAIDDITKEKLDILMKNLLKLDVDNEDVIKTNVFFVVKNNELATKLLEDSNFEHEAKRKYIHSTYDITEAYIKGEIPSLVSKGKYLVSYLDKSGKMVNISYEISITLDQDNPESNDFGYSISEIEIKK